MAVRDLIHAGALPLRPGNEINGENKKYGSFFCDGKHKALRAG